jgi:hypothetical protein
MRTVILIVVMLCVGVSKPSAKAWKKLRPPKMKKAK